MAPDRPMLAASKGVIAVDRNRTAAMSFPSPGTPPSSTTGKPAELASVPGC